jgi:hypothetical protein
VSANPTPIVAIRFQCLALAAIWTHCRPADCSLQPFFGILLRAPPGATKRPSRLRRTIINTVSKSTVPTMILPSIIQRRSMEACQDGQKVISTLHGKQPVLPVLVEESRIFYLKKTRRDRTVFRRKFKNDDLRYDYHFKAHCISIIATRDQQCGLRN